MSTRIPDWILERYALGELPPAREAEVRARIENEPAERARLEALRAADRDFLARHPTPAAAASIRARRDAHERESRRARIRLPAFAAAAASIALFFAVFGGGEEEAIRAKGLEPSLIMHRSQGGAIERLDDGAEARAGDLVQLSYLAAGRRYGVVLSVDGNGTVTLHHPLDGEWAAELSPEGATSLPHAYELDDAPSFERFYLLAADAPFLVEDALDAAREAAPGADRLPLDVSIYQALFHLTKK